MFLLSLFQWQVFAQNEDWGTVYLHGGCIQNSNDAVELYIGGDTDRNNTLGDLLVGYQENLGTKRELVSFFCDSLLHTQSKSGRQYQDGKKKVNVEDMEYRCFDEGDMRFDPRQSLFIYGVCVGFDDASKGTEGYDYRNYRKTYKDLSYTYDEPQITIDGSQKTSFNTDLTSYIPKDVDNNLIKEWWDLENDNDPCDPSREGDSMNTCALTYPFGNIQESILGELFDIKKASIDGYEYGQKEKDISKAVETLSRSLFDHQLNESGVCFDQNKIYLGDRESTANKNQSHCEHPQTNSFVKNTIEDAISSVDGVTLLDGHVLIQATCEDPKSSIHACAMTNRGDSWRESEELTWKNVLLNEYFYIDLREKYYKHALNFNQRLLGETSQGSAGAKSFADAKFEIIAMEENTQIMKEGIDTMQHLLSQYRSMYHSCIGLSAYQEDIDYFWTRLNNLYTPIHQNYYLFQDVNEAGG